MRWGQRSGFWVLDPIFRCLYFILWSGIKHYIRNWTLETCRFSCWSWSDTCQSWLGVQLGLTVFGDQQVYSVDSTLKDFVRNTQPLPETVTLQFFFCSSQTFSETGVWAAEAPPPVGVVVFLMLCSGWRSVKQHSTINTPTEDLLAEHLLDLFTEPGSGWAAGFTSDNVSYLKVVFSLSSHGRLLGRYCQSESGQSSVTGMYLFYFKQVETALTVKLKDTKQLNVRLKHLRKPEAGNENWDHTWHLDSPQVFDLWSFKHEIYC